MINLYKESTHTCKCGYCSYHGPVDEVIKHIHNNHQTETASRPLYYQFVGRTIHLPDKDGEFR